MALPPTRKLRKRLHRTADPLWKKGLMSRDRVYIMLASILEIDVMDCHIAMLTDEQLEKGIEFFETYVDEKWAALEKRKDRKIDRLTKKSRKGLHPVYR